MRDHRHPQLTQFARDLRRRSTDVEQILWYNLRRKNFGVGFRRQHGFPPYIVDFYCAKAKLVIELDGGQHTPEIDQRRTQFLEEHGLRVIRFWNNDVINNLDSVLEVIEKHVRERLK